MSQDPLDDKIPDFADTLVMDEDSGKSNLLAKLKGFFKKHRKDDAFGHADLDQSDPFAMQAYEDALFARRRRIVAIGMIATLVLLITGGIAAFNMDWSSPEPAPAVSSVEQDGPDHTAAVAPDPDSSGNRVVQNMPVASGPENLDNALMRPPGAVNPDAARRQGTLQHQPDVPAQGEIPQGSQEPTQPETTEPEPQAEPETATPPAQQVAVATPKSDISVPAIPSPREDFSQHATAPNLTDLPKLEPQKFDMQQAPQADLVRRMASGRTLPSISPEGRKPWQVYALAHKPAPNAPQISVILRGLGLSKPLTTAAVLRMPPQVTLAFSPYADQLAAQLNGARKQGHETLLTIDLETRHFPAVDPGPNGLFKDLSVDENAKRLEATLANGSVYLGILANGGDVFTQSTKHISALLDKIRDMGLLYIAPSPTVAPFDLVETKPARAIADVVISDNTFRNQAIAYLRQTEDIARSTGKAVVIADATPLSLTLISTWMAGLEQRGFQFAPISAVVTE